MDDLAALLTHIMEIKVSTAKIGERLDTIDKAVRGNGQPGLAQKVEELQDAKSRLWGALAVLGGLIGAGGVLEWLFHRGR